eukprot:Gb_35057 [translate_table: standard]
MMVQFISNPARCPGFKFGSNLQAYIPMDFVPFCRPLPVAFLRFNFQNSRNVNVKFGKIGGGKKNVCPRHKVRYRPQALNAQERLKGGPDEEMEKIIAFEKHGINSKNKGEKYEELSMAFASPVSPKESLIDNYYVVEGSKNLNKNLGLDSPGVESPIENKPSTLIEIPSLPDGSDGNPGSPISSCLWEWKHKWTVHYEKAGSHNVNAPAVLFLPGFGVGSFHYESQLRDLGQDFRVWAVDFLGQGRSLPSADPAPQVKGDAPQEIVQYWGFGPEAEPWARELVYSVDVWRDQIRCFVEQVIGEPVYVVGNSLGGFVGLYFAACNSHSVRGITLLNATPFWAFIPNPQRSPKVAKLFPWAGKFPLPTSAIKLIQFGWSKISDPKSIENVLKQVYADHSALTDELLLRILEATEHPAAAAAFASIICAPQGELSFNETLSRCQESNIPICLVYGKEDPWVKPVWGRQVKRQVPEALYYEISPAGHCPHNEVPEVVNFLLRGWIRSLESEGSVAYPLHDNPDLLQSNFWREMEFVKKGSRKSVGARVVANESSFWHHLLSVSGSLFSKLGIKAQ